SLQENGEQSSNITPKEYKVHRYVLSQQSDYFKVLFESSRNFIEHKENAVVIRLKDPFNVFPHILHLSFISAQEIYTLYLDAIENEFEEVIPDWLLAIAFDELWEIDNDVMSSVRLDRVLKCDCVKLKNEDQKFSVIRKIVADFCGTEEYDETFEEKWNKMALKVAMPFPDILEESEESSEE
ncbi:1514_t:CDS:2, partial [Racocetra fulgida]